jgi:hypothetical protein
MNSFQLKPSFSYRYSGWVARSCPSLLSAEVGHDTSSRRRQAKACSADAEHAFALPRFRVDGFLCDPGGPKLALCRSGGPPGSQFFSV